MVTVNFEGTVVKAQAQLVIVILLFFTSGARCEGEGEGGVEGRLRSAQCGSGDGIWCQAMLTNVRLVSIC
jgi:hypothetical protein